MRPDASLEAGAAVCNLVLVHALSVARGCVPHPQWQQTGSTGFRGISGKPGSAEWRVGVRKDEHTELIERGPFRWVRNPFFSFMLVATAGAALLLPNALSLAALLSLAVAAELQMRFAEEPYLLHTHGQRYAEYCQRVGRFVPGLGRKH